MKRVLVVAVLLITVFSFSSCYTSGVVVRAQPHYYGPRPYYGYYGYYGYHRYYGRPYYYGGYRHRYYGYGYHRW